MRGPTSSVAPARVGQPRKRRPGHAPRPTLRQKTAGAGDSVDWGPPRPNQQEPHRSTVPPRRRAVPPRPLCLLWLRDWDCARTETGQGRRLDDPARGLDNCTLGGESRSVKIPNATNPPLIPWHPLLDFGPAPCAPRRAAPSPVPRAARRGAGAAGAWPAPGAGQLATRGPPLIPAFSMNRLFCPPGRARAVLRARAPGRAHQPGSAKPAKGRNFRAPPRAPPPWPRPHRPARQRARGGGGRPPMPPPRGAPRLLPGARAFPAPRPPPPPRSAGLQPLSTGGSPSRHKPPALDTRDSKGSSPAGAPPRTTATRPALRRRGPPNARTAGCGVTYSLGQNKPVITTPCVVIRAVHRCALVMRPGPIRLPLAGPGRQGRASPAARQRGRGARAERGAPARRGNAGGAVSAARRRAMELGPAGVWGGGGSRAGAAGVWGGGGSRAGAAGVWGGGGSRAGAAGVWGGRGLRGPAAET
jgi:hypothetical protein